MLINHGLVHVHVLKAQANHEAKIVKDETTIELQHLPTQSYFW